MKVGRYRVGASEFWIWADAAEEMVRQAELAPGKHIVLEVWNGRAWTEDVGALFHGTGRDALGAWRRFTASQSR